MSIIRGLTFKCINNARGCPVELPKAKLAIHEASCQYTAQRLGGVIGLRFCEICSEAIISNEQAGRHLCHAAKYKYAVCKQHHLELLYKIPFGQVKEGRQLAVANLFKCSICDDLLAKPKTCGNCRVNFCTSCIADHLHD